MFQQLYNDNDNSSPANLQNNSKDNKTIVKSNAEFNINPTFEQSTNNVNMNMNINSQFNHLNHKSDDDHGNVNISDKMNEGFSAQFQFDETDYSNTEYIQDMLKD